MGITVVTAMASNATKAISRTSPNVVAAYAGERMRSRGWGGVVLVVTGPTVGPQVHLRSIGITNRGADAGSTVTAPSVDLSVLDLVPVRSDQTTGDAIAASRSLAQVADELGYRRYWVAEHHNMPAVAATNPPVLIAMLASATERIRVGSGGVMLPNHAPLVVAEQFALLEAAYPGRIDLGIGRAPGTDPLTRYVLRGGSRRRRRRRGGRSSPTTSRTSALMTIDGVELQVGAAPHAAARHPARRTSPTCGCSGRRTTRPDWPPRRACPTSSRTTSRERGPRAALDLYRSSYRPSPEYPEPRTFLTVNAVVAETEEEARRRALPNVQQMVALRTGAPLHPQRLVEEAEAAEMPPTSAPSVTRWRGAGSSARPTRRATRIEELAAETASTR